MAANPFFALAPALEALVNGTIDIDGDSYRMALVTAAYVPDQANDDAWSDISANEVANGNGYATHGKPVTGLAVTRAGLAITIDCDDVSWPASTIEAAYAVIVRDADGNGALAAGDIPVFACELENGGTVSTTNGTLTVAINAAGVYTLTADAAV